MSGKRDGERISFLGRQLPAGFAVRQVTIAGESERAYVHSEWAGALVVVEAGQIELECLSGSRASFASGAVLFFDSLPLRTLRNRRRQPAVLSSLTRCPTTAAGIDPG
jgi:hypothetical protein